ncbi:hypothetical protein [Phocaeicola sp.]
MDILTRLLLNTDGFDAKLGKSKGSVQSFESSITSMASKAGAGVLKLAGGIGVVMGATEAFNKVMNSSQTISDEYGRTMEGLKGTVDNFFYSISNGDFSPFLQGLNNSILLAREAYNSLDQLWNTATSYDYFSMKNQAGIQDQITVIKDKNSTKEQKEAAKAEAERLLKEQEEITEQLGRRSAEALTAMVRASTGFKNLDVTQINVEDILELDVKSYGDEKKAELAKQYKEFSDMAAKLQSKFVKTSISYSSMGVPMAQTETDYESFSKALNPLLKQYKESIAYNATLVKESDDWLTKATQIGTKAYMAERAVASLRKSVNRASQSDTGNGEKPKVDETQLVAADADYWLQQFLKSRGKFDAVAGTLQPVKIPIELDEEVLEEDLPQSEIEIKLKAKLENYDFAKKKIAELKELMKVATTPEEKEQLSGQVDEWAKFGGIVDNNDIDLNNNYAESLNIVANSLGNVANAMGVSSDSFLGYTANSLGAIAQMIIQLQALAGAEGIAAAFKMPFPINFAAAATVVSTVASLFSGLPKLANGGIAYGNSVVNVGEYAGASGNPEVIAPLSKLREYIQPTEGNTALGGEVVFTISGTTLKGVLTNVERKYKKFS